MSSEMYIATYSNVDVYECFIEDVPLMRRVRDDWVNATQILKAAKFPKAHRTRILEKEVQNGTHEKIQGGYGRFQGTWVPLDIARPFAEKYGITDTVAPILAYVPDPENPIKRKEKAKPSNAAPADTTDGTPVKKPRKQYNTKKRREAAAAAAANSSASLESNLPPASSSNVDQRNHSSQSLPPNNNRLSNDNSNFWQGSAPNYPPNSAPSQLPHLQPPPQLSQFKGVPTPNTYHQIPPNFPPQAPVSQQQYPIAYHQQQQQQQQQQLQLQHQQQQIPQQTHNQPQMQSFQQQQSHSQEQQFAYQQHRSRGSQENWSQDDASTHMDEVMQDSDTPVSSEHSSYDDAELTKSTYTEALIEFFSTECITITPFLRHPPSNFDFNDPIDDEGHTPLHWASSMASTGLIEILLKNGADPLVPNSSGLNCISRSIFFNNSYQEQNFHVLVDLMKNCLYTPDKQGRVPLHYLAASNSSKAQIAKYYTETILERLVKENGNLVKVVLNHKDINNETAFELAQKSNNKMVLEVLTQFGGGGHKVDEIHRNQQYDQSFNESVSMGDSPIESPTIPNVPTLPLKEVGPILTSMLSSLADAYDTELKNKEEESKHTESILENLKTDIRETGSQNDVILSQLENGNATYDELKVTITELEDSCSKKSHKLNKILERGQALKLAKLVHKEESAINHDHSGNENDHDDATKLKLACELTKLQLRRNKMISKIINELTTRNINSKMNSYRRLISISCGLKSESIDELIDEIEADLLTTVSTID